MLFFALFYALIFWVVAFKRPFYALVLVWSLSLFQTDLGIGIARFSLTELHLLLLMPLLLLRIRDVRGAASLGSLAWPISTYLFISLLSMMLHWRGSAAVVSMLQMLLYIVFTVQIFSSLLKPEDLRRIPQSLVITGAFWSLVGIATHFTFLGHLKNAFGSTLSMALLVAFDLWLAEPKGARRNWIMLGGSIIFMGLMLSLSRGGWLGAMGGMLVIIMLRRASYILMRGCIIAAPLLFICWNLLPQKKQDYAISFDTSRYNIRLRLRSLHKAQDAFLADPILGQGVGLRKQWDAINILWTTLAETGVLGAAAFVWVVVAFYQLAWRTRRQLNTKDPYFTLLSIGTALMTCKLLHGMVDHYWSRGAITLAWGGAGMVLVASRLPAQRAIEAARAQAEQKRLARMIKSQDAKPPRPIHAYAPLVPSALLPVAEPEPALQES
jgi:hypothetical protein